MSQPYQGRHRHASAHGRKASRSSGLDQGDPSPRGDLQRAARGHRDDRRRLPGRRPAPDRCRRLHGEHRGDRPGQRARGRPDRGHRSTGRRPQRHQRQHRRRAGEGPRRRGRRRAGRREGASSRRPRRSPARRLARRSPPRSRPSSPTPRPTRAAAAQALLPEFGFDESQWSCLDNLWMGESGWRYTAENSSSGAYGIPQSLPGLQDGHRRLRLAHQPGHPDPLGPDVHQELLRHPVWRLERLAEPLPALVLSQPLAQRGGRVIASTSRASSSCCSVSSPLATWPRSMTTSRIGRRSLIDCFATAAAAS